MSIVALIAISVLSFSTFCSRLALAGDAGKDPLQSILNLNSLAHEAQSKGDELTRLRLLRQALDIAKTNHLEGVADQINLQLKGSGAPGGTPNPPAPSGAGFGKVYNVPATSAPTVSPALGTWTPTSTDRSESAGMPTSTDGSESVGTPLSTDTSEGVATSTATATVTSDPIDLSTFSGEDKLNPVKADPKSSSTPEDPGTATTKPALDLEKEKQKELEKSESGEGGDAAPAPDSDLGGVSIAVAPTGTVGDLSDIHKQVLKLEGN